jgi:cytochrome c peroxidase
VKAQLARLSIAAAMVAVTLGADAPGAEESSTMLSPKALQEIALVETDIDRIAAQTIERLAAPPDNQVQQIELLGKLLLYDKQLSVNRNEACAFCHMPEMGFTGPVSELNRTTGSYPGSVRTRFSDRKPQSHSYAPLAPVLHYNPGQGDLVGGNFWDMRATGRRLGNPAAEQAEGLPTNPTEMGLPDYACAVYRASQRPYRALFESVWGLQAFAIAWPSDVERVCARPGPPPADEPMPVPAGPTFVDGGVGSFLANGHQLSQPSAVDARWLKLAPDNQARIQVPTLRNVDKRPYLAFVKAYGHNAYFTSLKAIVHFYNTRDVLPRCQPHDAGEGTTCWPALESTANMNTSRVGRLGLSDAEEDAIVTFLQTLTDGFMPANR